MLYLLQAALPPIHVTVQQPPGLPEWAKAAISAGIGALFGIISSMAMEFVKPWIGSLTLRLRVKRQVQKEFL
jgi:hypothetical protein